VPSFLSRHGNAISALLLTPSRCYYRRLRLILGSGVRHNFRRSIAVTRRSVNGSGEKGSQSVPAVINMLIEATAPDAPFSPTLKYAAVEEQPTPIKLHL